MRAVGYRFTGSRERVVIDSWHAKAFLGWFLGTEARARSQGLRKAPPALNARSGCVGPLALAKVVVRRQQRPKEVMKLASVGEKFKPGEVVPDSGFYECDGSCSHEYSTDVKGHRFPPVPAGCRGSNWVLKRKRP